MKNLIVAIYLLASSSVSAQLFYSGPESVEFDYTNNRWLIGNTGTGDILARDVNGELSIFAEDFCSSGPYGLEIVNDLLYACGNDGSIFIFNLDGTQLVDSPIDLGADFLNGITHDDTGQLYITDFEGQSIYKMDAITYQFSIVANSIDLNSTPNGIIFDEENNRCIIVTWGSNAEILALDVATNTISTLVANTGLGNIDGITKNSAGTYFLSSWAENAISTIDNAFSTAPVQIIDSLDSPADIFYNTVSDTLAVPNSGNNTVDFFGFEPIVSVSEISKPASNLSIYPNPSDRNTNVKFTIKQSSKTKYTITDVLGKIALDGGESFLASGDHEIMIKNLETGFYFFNLFVENKLSTLKFQVIK